MNVRVIYILFIVTFFGKEANGEASKIIADYLLDGLKKEAKPCEDTFNFVCGKWLDNLAVHNDTNNYFANYFFEQTYLQNQTKKVLLEAIKSINVADKSTPMYKIWLRTFYDQCIISNMSKTDTAKQIFNGLQRVIGPPPLMTMNKTVYDILIKRNIWNLLGQVQRKLADGVFFKTSVENTQNDCDKTVPVLSFEPQSLYDLDQEMNATEIKSSVTFMARVLAVTIDDAELDKKIKNVIDLNEEFVQFLNETQTEEYNDFYLESQLLNATELASINAKIDWQEFLKGLFSDQFDDYDQTTAKFLVREKKYFKKIDSLVTKYDVETIFNYVFYKAMDALTETLSAIDEDFLADPVGQCIENVVLAYSPAAAKTYFDFTQQNPSEWQSDLNIIVDNIRTSFKQIVSKTQWLSSQEKAKIFEKANHVKYSSPIPDWLLSDEAIENRTIKFDADKGVHDNAVNIAKWVFHMELERLLTGQESDVDITFFPSSFFDMEISSYFGNVLPPLYHFDYPLAIKYAIFGAQIGSSLMQRFESTGWDFYYGDQKQWLNESNAGKLDEQTLCLDNQITQLDCKNVPEMKCADRDWTWNLTLNKLLREIDGFNVAYNAYKMVSQPDESNQLSGLTDYDWDQIFLLSYGRRLCSTYTTDSLDEGGESTTQNEIIKIFRNLPLFGKSFKCPQNGPISVDKPCGVWKSIN